jgi:flagellar basal-body rod protein FlgF
MDPLTITAASGMRARIDSLDLLANNLANVNTAGFKADRDTYSQYLADESTTDFPSLAVLEREWTDHGQGVLTETGNQLDVALDGNGFLTVQAGSGVLYTRNGSLRISPAGQLQTATGDAILSVLNKPIVVDPSQPVSILRDGTVQQAGIAVGQIALAGGANLSEYRKLEGGYFQWLSPAAGPPRASGAELRQGMLENSNVGAPESAVRLISIMRQFESLQKALVLAGDMNRRAIEEVARVS